jgi:hypothetical protein
MQRSAPVQVEILGIKDEQDNPQITSKSPVFVAFISGLCTMCVVGAQPFTTCRKSLGSMLLRPHLSMLCRPMHNNKCRLSYTKCALALGPLELVAGLCRRHSLPSILKT